MLSPQDEECLTYLPPFVSKLYYLVMDPNTDHLISWDQQGIIVVIHDKKRLIKEGMADLFELHSYESLIKQLNNYGFSRYGNKHRLPVMYVHPFFKRGDVYHLQWVVKGAQKFLDDQQEDHIHNEESEL